MDSGGRDDTWDPDHLQRRLQSMGDYEFEHLVGDLWEIQGWDIEVEQQSADAGVDVRATQTSPYPRKVLIQAKRYSEDNPVNGPDVQQYAALKQQESDTDESIIVTTGRFTSSAEDRAKDLNVKLLNGEGLVDLIEGLNAYEVVEGYIGQPQGGRTRNQTRKRSAERKRATRGDDFRQLTPEERTEIERVVGQDLDDRIREEQYQATRAMERARAVVELNPHDAKELGIFDDAPLHDFEREFTDKKTQLVFLKDDIHANDDGDIYVEDLTDYIKPSVIQGGETSAVVGVIKRGVKDQTWLSEEGREYWRTHRRLRRLKRKGKGLLSSVLENENSDSIDSQSGRTAATESPGSVAPTSDVESQNVSTHDDSISPSKPESLEEGKEEEPVQASSRSEGLDSNESSDRMQTNSKNTELPSTGELDTQEMPRKTGTSASVRREHEPSVQADSPEYDLSRTNWFYGVAIATGAWALAWVLVIALPNATSSLVGLSSVIAWFLLPASMFMDTRNIGKFETEKARSLAYIIASLVPVLAVIPGSVYLYRRENSWGR